MLQLRVLLVFASIICVCWGKVFEINAFPEHDLQSRIGPKECAKGSKYWCQDIRTAKECGAVKHCIQVVWEHKKLPADNNEICETCKKMVAEARDELQSNQTQDLIKQVLEGTCNIYFPIKVIANECIKIVDEFIPEFIEILSSRMDPQTVCSVAWLCNSNKVQDLIRDVELVGGVKSKTSQFAEGFSSVSDSCEDCKTFATDAIAKVKSMGEPEFGRRLKDFCSQLHGALSSLCKMAVESKTHEIYEYVTTEMKPQEVCALAAMCVDGLDPVEKKPNTKKPVIAVKAVKSNDVECELCIQLTTRLRDLVVANSSKEEVRQVLLNICSHLKLYKDQCTSYVKDYFDEIYNFIVDEMNPKLICSILGLCSNRFVGNDEKAAHDREHPNKISGIIVKYPFSKKYSAASTIPSAVNCKVHNVGSVQCALCEFALHQIQSMLGDNRTEAAIEDALKRVCDLLPPTLGEQCANFIQQYGPAIFALLAQELDPSIICTELQLCPSQKISSVPILPSPDKTMERMTNLDVPQLPIDRMVSTNKKLEGKEECLFCQYSMELISNVLNMNGTKSAIVLGLDDVCHTLPANWRDTCDQFVDIYAESFITMLQKQNLTQVCDMLSVCSGVVGVSMYPHANQAAKAAVEHSGSDKCMLCEVTVQMLTKLLNNPTVSGDFVKAVEEICVAVPKANRDKCQSAIEVYGPYFLKMLAQFAEPKHVCQLVHLCEPSVGQVNLLGAKKCTYGPSYWCKSKVHAKACHAEEHCKKYVWKN
ncbi:hypothetical protein CHUAL_007684 [Chamberlinius hualienensis]